MMPIVAGSNYERILTSLRGFAQQKLAVSNYKEQPARLSRIIVAAVAEVAFIRMALVKAGQGNYLEVKEELHQPIDQALEIIKASPKQAWCRHDIAPVASPG